MPSVIEACDHETDRICIFPSGLKAGNVVLDSVIHAHGDTSTESLMWSMLVVPVDVECNLTSDAFKTQRNKNTSGAFVLHGAYQSLDDGDAPIIANGSEALFDVPRFGTAPPSEFIRCELTALVGNEMFGCCSHSADRLGHKFDNFISSRLFLEDGEANDSTGEMVNHHDDPPTERPNLRQAEWSPWYPEACCGDSCHIDMPNVVGVSCGDDSTFLFLFDEVRNRLVRKRFFFQDASDSCSAKVQSRSAQHLSDAYLTHGRAEDFESLDYVADIVGVLVHGLGEL